MCNHFGRNACPFYVTGFKMCAGCSHRNDKTVHSCLAVLLSGNAAFKSDYLTDTGTKYLGDCKLETKQINVQTPFI